MVVFQGSADSNYSQPSSDLSLDEEKETLRREKERQALSQLEKARVKFPIKKIPSGISSNSYAHITRTAIRSPYKAILVT